MHVYAADWLLLLLHSCCLLFSVVYFDCCSDGLVQFSHFQLMVSISTWSQRVGVCHRDFLIENLMNTCRHCIHCALSWILDAQWMHEYLWISSIEKQNEWNNFYSFELRGGVSVLCSTIEKSYLNIDRTTVYECRQHPWHWFVEQKALHAHTHTHIHRQKLHGVLVIHLTTIYILSNFKPKFSTFRPSNINKHQFVTRAHFFVCMLQMHTPKNIAHSQNWQILWICQPTRNWFCQLFIFCRSFLFVFFFCCAIFRITITNEQAFTSHFWDNYFIWCNWNWNRNLFHWNSHIKNEFCVIYARAFCYNEYIIQIHVWHLLLFHCCNKAWS